MEVGLIEYPDLDASIANTTLVAASAGATLLDLDDTIGGEFQTTFWDQLKLLWVQPGQLDNVLAAIQAVAPARAIYIRADGSVEGTTHITSVDNVTYAFTGNIYDEIVVERDNIVVDGAGYTVQGTGSGTGIDLSDRSNVTIKNVEVTNFNTGIYLYYSSNNTLAGNTVSSNNNVGIYLGSSSNNVLFHNNLISNTVQASVTTGYVNTWDDGYPSGGNYWSDHVCTGNPSDGSQPYVIDANNIDHYPFQDPMGWLLPDTTPPAIVVLSPQNTTYTTSSVPLTFTISEPASWMGYSLDGQLNVTVAGNTTLTGLSDGVHGITLYANDTSGNMGSSSKVYFTIDTTSPTIGVPSRTPDDDILPEQEVKVSVSVTDVVSGVKNVTLSYTIDDGITWTNLPMNYNASTTLYQATIPKQRAGTWVKYKIVAHDNAENPATKDGTDPYCIYQVIPEFPSATILPILMILTILAVAFTKRRFPRKPPKPNSKTLSFLTDLAHSSG